MKHTKTDVTYVLAKDGKPLMPTRRFGHVRKLLKSGRAKPVPGDGPFTVRLTYESPHYTQPITVGIDMGQTNIGAAAVTKNGDCVFAGHLTTRNTEIPKLMRARKAFRMAHRKHGRRERRQRRAIAHRTARSVCLQRILPQCKEPIVCKHIKNKPARFCNRRRKDGWLSPTATQLLRTHVNLIRKVAKFLPITDVVIEANRFAFMELEAGHRLFGEAFQKGLLYGYDGLQDYVRSTQEDRCLLCGKGIDHFHHLIPKRYGGSDTARNIAGLCAKCHALVHTNAPYRRMLADKKRGLLKQYAKAGVLNQVVPYVLKELDALYPGHLHVTDGRETKRERMAHGIKKAHHLDAYVIACNGMDAAPSTPPSHVYEMMQFRRHNRQACKKANLSRKYYLDGKLIATNRRKAFEQKLPSLAEYRASGGKTDRLTVRKHLPIYQRINRIPRGSLMLADGKPKVFVASQGLYKGRPCYYTFADGTKVKAKTSILIWTNSGIVFVSKTVS